MRPPPAAVSAPKWSTSDQEGRTVETIYFMRRTEQNRLIAPRFRRQTRMM